MILNEMTQDMTERLLSERDIEYKIAPEGSLSAQREMPASTHTLAILKSKPRVWLEYA